MIVWIDAQLSPAVASWLKQEFGVEATAVRDLGLRDSGDRVIFYRARQAGAIVLSKDADFAHLVQELGAPPQVIWVTTGNTSNARLQQILTSAFPRVRRMLEADESLVEIGDTPGRRPLP